MNATILEPWLNSKVMGKFVQADDAELMIQRFVLIELIQRELFYKKTNWTEIEIQLNFD